MLFPDVEFDVADFEQANWEQVLEQAQHRQCAYYSSALYSAAREARERNDIKTEAVFALLGAAATLDLRSGERDRPYVAAMALGTARTAVLGDFSEAHLDIFRDLVGRTIDCDMRARLADILWERRRDRVMAELAVDAYLQSARLLEHPREWSPCFERIERALRIAARLGLTGAYFNRVLTQIHETLDRYQGTDPLYLSARLMELLIEHRQGRPVVLARYARVAAMRAEQDGDWRRVRKYRTLLADWQTRAGHQQAANQSRRASAEAYVKEAQAALKVPAQGALAATVHIQSAIQAMRKVAGTSRRIAELNQMLLRYGQRSIGEMQHASSSVDARPMIERSVSAVKDKSFRDALFALVTLFNPPRLDALRES